MTTAPAPNRSIARIGGARLWIALFVNGGFFLAEIIAGLAAGSAALQADALDFFGDAGNYAISLGVTGMALTWRARAARLT
jgi:Co/Zn/Cd efflux system component